MLGLAHTCPNTPFVSHTRAALSTGSEYKIDASYLSPNVNLASRLVAATKQYSVPMLLSRAFVDCLTPGVRAKVGDRGQASVCQALWQQRPCENSRRRHAQPSQFNSQPRASTITSC